MLLGSTLLCLLHSIILLEAGRFPVVEVEPIRTTLGARGESRVTKREGRKEGNHNSKSEIVLRPMTSVPSMTFCFYSLRLLVNDDTFLLTSGSIREQRNATRDRLVRELIINLHC